MSIKCHIKINSEQFGARAIDESAPSGEICNKIVELLKIYPSIIL